MRARISPRRSSCQLSCSTSIMVLYMKDLLDIPMQLNSMQQHFPNIFLQVISEMQLDIKGCVRKPMYDGGSVISGECAGVSAKILERNTKAVYAHCCAHRLNLVLVKQFQQLKTSLACYRCCMSSCPPLRPMKYFLNSRKC